MLHRGTRRALVLLFCGCLAAVGVLYLALPKADFSEREKRRLAELPELTWSGVLSGDFESDFERWMSDHIPGREALVGLNAYYSLASGRNGLDGTLYADGKLYDAAWELDADAVARKCEIISRFARETGLPTDVLIVPTSGYMCESKLPMHAKYRDGELAELVRGGLSGGAHLIWPEEALRAAGGQLYYNTDHHLTSRGAYEICKLYVESLGLEMPGEDEYDVEVHEGFYGSMYAQSGLWAVKPDSLESGAAAASERWRSPSTTARAPASCSSRSIWRRWTSIPYSSTATTRSSPSRRTTRRGRTC